MTYVIRTNACKYWSITASAARKERTAQIGLYRTALLLLIIRVHVVDGELLAYPVDCGGCYVVGAIG
jgi:hypothetical protein